MMYMNIMFVYLSKVMYKITPTKVITTSIYHIYECTAVFYVKKGVQGSIKVQKGAIFVTFVPLLVCCCNI